MREAHEGVEEKTPMTGSLSINTPGIIPALLSPDSAFDHTEVFNECESLSRGMKDLLVTIQQRASDPTDPVSALLTKEAVNELSFVVKAFDAEYKKPHSGKALTVLILEAGGHVARICEPLSKIEKTTKS